MAAQQQPPRPPYNPRQSYSPNALSPPAFSPSNIHYAPPHAYPNSLYAQQHPPKRVRLSSDPSSPLNTAQGHAQSFQTPQSASSPNGGFVNGLGRTVPPGVMGPPSRPADRAEDRDFDSVLAGTGINIEEEDRKLTIPASDFYGKRIPSSTFQPAPPRFGHLPHNMSDRSVHTPGESPEPDSGSEATVQSTPEELQRMREAQADWDAGRRAQYTTWDLFLQGEEVQKRVLQTSSAEHLPQVHERGLMRPSRDYDPQPTRVNGLGDAYRIINQGQTILHLEDGKELRSIIDVVTLAAKERLTGIVDLSARFAHERRLYSSGRVPVEWESMAVVPTAQSEMEIDASSPGSSAGMKRPRSQPATDQPKELVGVNRMAEYFQRVAKEEKAAEAVRLAKRAKRLAAANPDAAVVASDSVADAATSSADADKKVTKKDRKLADSRFAEQQQHKSANETARMATSGVLGRKKSYSWMKGSGGNAASTPPKSNPTLPTSSAAATSSVVRTATAPKEKVMGHWDETKDSGIQLRDVLLVLEGDRRAPMSYMRGYAKDY